MTMGDSGLYEVRTFHYVVVLAIAIFSRGKMGKKHCLSVPIRYSRKVYCYSNKNSFKPIKHMSFNIPASIRASYVASNINLNCGSITVACFGGIPKKLASNLSKLCR